MLSVIEKSENLRMDDVDLGCVWDPSPGFRLQGPGRVARRGRQALVAPSRGWSPRPWPWRRMQGVAANGLGGRTYSPGPLTLGVRQRSGCDNFGNFTPTGVGTTEAEKQQKKRWGRLTKSAYG